MEAGLHALVLPEVELLAQRERFISAICPLNAGLTWLELEAPSAVPSRIIACPSLASASDAACTTALASGRAPWSAEETP